MTSAEINAQASEHFNAQQRLGGQELSAMCANRGKPDWAGRIKEGVELHRQLVQTGSVSAEMFEQW